MSSFAGFIKVLKRSYIAVAGGVIGLVISGLASESVSGQEVLKEEDRVKATYILSFILYTTWLDPASVEEQSAETVDICSMRGDPFLGFMRNVLEEKKQLEPGYESLRIHQYTGDIHESCEVLFIHNEASETVQPNNYARDGLLLIGESPGFATNGGIINFIIDDDSVRFEINFEELRARNLVMNSQVLRLATIVP